MNPNCEKIVVREADLRRWGNDIKKLRQCQLSPYSNESMSMSRPQDQNVSFKSAFQQKCLSETSLRNPWEELENPEISRMPNEGDLTVNQVWVGHLQNKKLNSPLLGLVSPSGSHRARSASTTASSEDASAYHDVSVPGSRHRRARRRSSSRSDATKLGSSLRQHSGDVAATDGDPPHSTVASRIRLLDDHEFVSLDSIADTPERHQRKLDDWLVRKHARPHALWVVIDPNSGHVHVFPKAVAVRLESAHLDRASVPLAGLGEAAFDGSIVSFGGPVGDGGYVERRPEGPRDVRRIQVVGTVSNVVVHVLPPGALSEERHDWRISDEPVPGKSRELVVPVCHTHLVSPPSPKVQEKVDRSRTWINFGAFEEE